MKFAHGSEQDILNSKEQSHSNDIFQLFDYIKNGNSKCSNEFIDNGNDGEGIGLYAMIGNSEESIGNAKLYTGNGDHGGFVYLLDVDIEEHELMNLREPDEISVDDWVDGIEFYIDNIRKQSNLSYPTFEEVINSFLEKDDFTLEEVNNKLKDLKMDIELSIDPEDFEDTYSWKVEVDEEYYLLEPCSFISDEGGARSIVEYAIEGCDDLYGVLRKIGETCSITYSQKGIEKYNKTFQESMINSVGKHHDLTAAFVDNDNFAVIFDTTKIRLDSVIDLAAEHIIEESHKFLESNKKVKPETKNKLTR